MYKARDFLSSSNPWPSQVSLAVPQLLCIRLGVPISWYASWPQEQLLKVNYERSIRWCDAAIGCFPDGDGLIKAVLVVIVALPLLIYDFGFLVINALMTTLISPANAWIFRIGNFQHDAGPFLRAAGRESMWPPSLVRLFGTKCSKVGGAPNIFEWAFQPSGRLNGFKQHIVEDPGGDSWAEDLVILTRRTGDGCHTSSRMSIGISVDGWSLGNPLIKAWLSTPFRRNHSLTCVSARWRCRLPQSSCYPF